MSKLLKSKSGWENRIYIETRSVFLCHVEPAENFNLPKSEDSKQPQCPKEKEKAIMEALKVFKMV